MVGHAAVEVKVDGERRYFIIGPQEVVVVDQSLQVLRRLPLDGIAPAGSPSAFDASTGLLAVAAGHALYLIDTNEATIVRRIEAETEIAGVSVAPEGGAVNVLFKDSGLVRPLDLESFAWGTGSYKISSSPVTLVSSASGAVAAAGNNIFDLSRLERQFFGEPPQTNESEAGATLDLFAGGPSGATLLASGGFLRLHSAGGAEPLIRDAGGEPLPAAQVGGATFLADGGLVIARRDTRTLIRTDSEGKNLGDITLAGAPAALALAPTPVEQSPPPTYSVLTKLQGDNQTVAAGAEFILRIGHPLSIHVTITVAPSNIADCPVAVDLPFNQTETSITCTAKAVAATTPGVVTITGPPAVGAVSFNVTVFKSGGADGLFIISGDNQTVGSGAAVSLVAEFRQGGAPASGEMLEVEYPGSLLDCPDTVSTAATGLATIICTAADVSTDEPAVIDVIHGSDSISFSVTIQPGAGSGGLTKASTDPVNVVEGNSFNLMVDAQAGGNPDAGLTLDINVSNSFVTCPQEVNTNAQGRATAACTANNVTQNRSSTVSFSDGDRSVTFTINVVDSNSAGGIQKVAGDNQYVPLVTETQPFVVSVFANGVPRPNVQLSVLIKQVKNYLFCPGGIVTNSSGIASFTCTTGSNVVIPEVLRVEVRDLSTGIVLEEPFTITVLPTQGQTAHELDLLSKPALKGRVGETLEDAIQVSVKDAVGDPLPGGLVFFRARDKDVTFDPPVAVANALGKASTNVVFGCPGPTGTISVDVDSTDPAELTVDYAVAVGSLTALVATQGDGQSGSAGQTLPLALVAMAQDFCGNGLASQPISWSINPPSAAQLLPPTGVQTNNGGVASARIQLGSSGGAFTVTAASGEQQAVFHLTVNSLPTSLTAVSGGGQSVPAGAQASAPIVVRVANAQEQGVAGVPVEFEVISGAGSVQPASAQTGEDGQAAAIVTAGQSLGEIIIEARAINQTVRFSLFVVGRTPLVPLEGIVNGASFRTGLTPGGTGTIFGQRLTQGVDGGLIAPYNNGFPLEFRGVSVTINGISAPILGLANVNGQEQINIQVPFGVLPGTATVIVTNNGASTTITGVQILAQQPGIFEISVAGGRYAAALHADYSLVTPSNPARPNEVILLFLTSLGLVEPAVPTNVPGPANPLSRPPGTIVVGINNAGVPNLGVFYAPGLITVYQVNFRTGASLPNGTVNLTVVYNQAGSQTVLLPTASQ